VNPHDLGNIGSLTPEAIARAQARRAAREAGQPRAVGDRVADLAAALREREKAGEPIPTLTEDTLENVVLKPGGPAVPGLLRALVGAQARRTAADPTKLGAARLGAAPAVRSAAASLTGHGPLTDQVRRALPAFGTAFEAPGRVR